VIRDNLDPDLEAYIEYSNECWLWSFAQTSYCRQMGMEMGISGGGPAAYYAVRSAQMWAIFEEVFAGQTHRLVKVLAAQSGAEAFGLWMFPFIDSAEYNPTGTRPDVLAIAPYLNNHPQLPIADVTHEEWFDSVMARIIPDKRARMASALQQVEPLGLPLVTYEGGQSFVGGGTKAVEFYVAANQHPRMKDVYLAYLEDWFELGGGMFMHYASCALGSQYGSWGCKEYYNQPRSEAPKYDALLTFIEDSIGAVGTDPPPLRVQPQVRPAPREGQLATFLLTGRLSPVSVSVVGGGSQTGSTKLARGVYAVVPRSRLEARTWLRR
jgi:hypothetical protein